MRCFKKTAAALFFCGVNASIAGTMGSACAPGSVTVPCDNNGWRFDAEALYLKPAYSASTVFSSNRNNADVTILNDLNPDWGWGFMVAGAYQFSTGNDLLVNWYHYQHNTYHLVNSLVLNDDVAEVLTLNTELRAKWDAVNAEFGQLSHFGEHKRIRFHGGFQYARINNDYLNNVVDETAIEQINMKFNGFGPRIGTDLAYHWSNGLSTGLTKNSLKQKDYVTHS